MNQYEVTFIVDPVLSDPEIKATSNNYVDHLKSEGCAIVHVDELGLKQLAYSIKRRNSGFYYCIEFQTDSREIIAKLELALRRDERIMRFLTVKLDKFGVKYNDDKRKGLIKKKEKKQDPKAKETAKPSRSGSSSPAKKTEAPMVAAAVPVAEAVATEVKAKEETAEKVVPETVATETAVAEPAVEASVAEALAVETPAVEIPMAETVVAEKVVVESTEPKSESNSEEE
jgi:small subunit ribosomal protein S6